MDVRNLWDEAMKEATEDVLYGEVTQQAMNCSSIGAPKIPQEFLRIMALVKYACAKANGSLSCISQEKAELIQAIALEIYQGKWAESFPLEIFQSGGCTPTHMNLNEVISGIAKKYKATDIHPNDDCNYGQSTNDVIPTTLNIAIRECVKQGLLPALEACKKVLEGKENEWSDLAILGRTHTMDAVPMTLGQIFSGYRRQLEKNIESLQHNLGRFLELPIGGTAVGNGLNSYPDFGSQVIHVLNQELQESYISSKNRFEQQSSRDDYVFFAGLLDTLATSLIKIANDIRWYGSGPAGGLNELILQKTHAGSSCMPGKVNPVVCETLLQACVYVQSHCDSIRRCAVIGGQFQLNTTSMLLIYAVLDSIRTLAKSLNLFTKFVLEGLQANYTKIKEHLTASCAQLTALVPLIGYDLAAEIVQKARIDKSNLLGFIKEKRPDLEEETIKKVLNLLQ
ncbi:MAG: lyase family protein [Opitutales bacterium]